VLQAASLVIVIASFYKIVRNFNRPVPASPQQTAQARQQMFFRFVRGMTLLQEQLARVLHNKDVSQVESVTRSVIQMTAPDARATALRDRLLTILSKAVRALNNQQPMDQSLTDEFNTWHEDYLEWFKGAH
jgi:hypothetical protein